jgi:hypothetical protein
MCENRNVGNIDMHLVSVVVQTYTHDEACVLTVWQLRTTRKYTWSRGPSERSTLTSLS